MWEKLVFYFYASVNGTIAIPSVREYLDIVVCLLFKQPVIYTAFTLSPSLRVRPERRVWLAFFPQCKRKSPAPRGGSDSPFLPQQKGRIRPASRVWHGNFFKCKQKAESAPAIDCKLPVEIPRFIWASIFYAHSPYPKNCVSGNALHQLCARRAAHVYMYTGRLQAT